VEEQKIDKTKKELTPRRKEKLALEMHGERLLKGNEKFIFFRLQSLI